MMVTGVQHGLVLLLMVLSRRQTLARVLLEDGMMFLNNSYLWLPREELVFVVSLAAQTAASETAGRQ